MSAERTVDGRWWLSVAALVALASASFAMGAHIGNKEIHQEETMKRALIQDEIDRSMDREVIPRLERIERQLETLVER